MSKEEKNEHVKIESAEVELMCLHLSVLVPCLLGERGKDFDQWVGADRQLYAKILLKEAECALQKYARQVEDLFSEGAGGSVNEILHNVERLAAYEIISRFNSAVRG